MISIVCVYNNREILDEYLLKSLNHQNTDYELILLDNTNSKFNSAAKALNYGGEKSNGKYIMFVHQDIDFLSNNWLKDAEKTLNSIPNLGIAGVAGNLNKKKGIITNIKDGIPPKPIVIGSRIHSFMKAQTVDECLFIIPKNIFEMFQFDEKICDDWHLYAVDYSLNISKHGFGVYVLPLSLNHMSRSFSLSIKYYSTLKKILSKYKNDYNWIYTTIGDWNNTYPIFIQNILLKQNWILKMILRRYF